MPLLYLLVALEISMPSVPIDQICKNANAASLPEDKARAMQVCQNDETSARNTLQKQWSGFAATAVKNCVDPAEMGFSYVALLTCLQMQDFAKKQANPGSKIDTISPKGND